MQDIAPETTLFTIPRKAIVNVETSDLRKKLPALFEEDDVADDDGHGDEDGDDTKKQQLDSWTSLILIMMYEFLLDDKSSWKSYFEVLPESFDTPMFWSENELRELQASATVGKIGREAADDMFRGTLLPAIRGNPDIFVGSSQRSDDELVTLAHRMGSTIMAYAFDLENDEEDDDEEDGWVEDREGKAMMGMVPMADIMNADAEFNVSLQYNMAHACSMLTQRIGSCQPWRRQLDCHCAATHQGRRGDSQLLRSSPQFGASSTLRLRHAASLSIRCG